MALESTGTAWVFGDDINTDLILPGAAFLLPVEEQVRFCFSANRPGWNATVKPGDIIVAGRNFGLGSARPIGNVFSHLGVAGIVATTFNGLGLRNCVNYGVHVLPCDGASDAIEDGDRITVDWQTGIVKNLSRQTEVVGKALPKALLNIAEAGGVVAQLRAEGLLEDTE